MNIVLKTTEQTLISLSNSELLGLVNSLNEVCNGVHIPESGFATRLGLERGLLLKLHQELLSEPPVSTRRYELADAWAEPASIMVRAVTVFGDPVEMSTSEAERLVSQLQQSIQEAA